MPAKSQRNERSKESEKNKKNRIENKWINFNDKLMILNIMLEDGITAATDFMDKLEQFVNAECIIQAGKVLQLQWQLSKQGVNNTHISEMALNRRI